MFFTAIPICGAILQERKSGIWIRLTSLPVSHLALSIYRKGSSIYMHLPLSIPDHRPCRHPAVFASRAPGLYHLGECCTGTCYSFAIEPCCLWFRYPAWHFLCDLRAGLDPRHRLSGYTRNCCNYSAAIWVENGFRKYEPGSAGIPNYTG